MVKLWTHWKWPTHAVFAGVVALLVALHGLFLPAPLPGDPSIVAFSTAYCGAHDGGENSPAPTPHHHSHCCVLCAAGEHETPAPIVVAVVVAIDREQETGDELARMFVDDAKPRLIGWTSSWSSRAPPAAGGLSDAAP